MPTGKVKIRDADDTKCQGGYGAEGTLTCAWWECKMVQPLWKTVWHFLKKLNIFLGHLGGSVD